MTDYGTTTEGASSQTQQALREQAQQASEKVREVGGTAQDRIRQQVDTRSTQAGDQVASVGEAMRGMGDQLQGEGNDLPAQLVHQAAATTEELARYLREADADRILRDIEDFGRQQPWLVAAAGLAVGVAAARFLKASSRRRYEEGGYGSVATQPVAPPQVSTYGAVPYQEAAEPTTPTSASQYPSDPLQGSLARVQEAGTYPPRGSE